MDTLFTLFYGVLVVLKGACYFILVVIFRDAYRALPRLSEAIARWRAKGMPAARRRRWYRELLADIRRTPYITEKFRLALRFRYSEPLDDMPKITIDERKSE